MNAEMWENQVKLWKARKDELGITFDELADATQISRRQLFYLFGGKAKNPGIENVHRVNKALGIEEEKTPTDDLSDGEKQLISLIKQLTDEETEELSNFVDFILSKRK